MDRKFLTGQFCYKNSTGLDTHFCKVGHNLVAPFLGKYCMTIFPDVYYVLLCIDLQ